MKQLLMNSVISLVTGFFFVAGAFLAASLFDNEGPSDRKHVDEPQGFEFTNHERVSGADKFTVKGIIKNTSNTEWDSIQIFLKIYAGDAYMNYCRNSFSYLAPASERPFTIACSDITGHNIPENVTYRLSVNRATIKK